MEVTSPTPPHKTAIRKSFGVTPAPGLLLVASRKLLCFPLRTTARKVTPTATLRPSAPTDASWLSVPLPLILSPILRRAARFICATPAPAPPRNALRKQLLSPPTSPVYSPATIIYCLPSVLPAAL